MATDTTPTKLQVFKSTIPFMNFIFPNGKPAIFQNGVFRTSNENEAQHLDYEISQGHPHIYRDAQEKEVMSNEVDPISVLRKKIIDEYKAQLEAATNPANDMGNSQQGPVKPANSSDVAAAAAGGNGQVSTFAVNKTPSALAAALGKSS